MQASTSLLLSSAWEAINVRFRLETGVLPSMCGALALQSLSSRAVVEKKSERPKEIHFWAERKTAEGQPYYFNSERKQRGEAKWCS